MLYSSLHATTVQVWQMYLRSSSATTPKSLYEVLLKIGFLSLEFDNIELKSSRTISTRRLRPKSSVMGKILVN